MPQIIESFAVQSTLPCAPPHLALFLALSITLSFALYFSLLFISRDFGPLEIPGPRPSQLFPQMEPWDLGWGGSFVLCPLSKFPG